VKIKEVLINLLSNAVKFTDYGGRINAEISCLRRLIVEQRYSLA